MLEMYEIAKAVLQQNGLLNEIRRGSTTWIQKVSELRRVFRAGWSFAWILDTGWSLDIGLNVSKTDIGFQRPKDALKPRTKQLCRPHSQGFSQWFTGV